MVGLQLTHVPLTRELPDGHTQLLLTIMSPEAQPQVLLAVKVKFPTQFWQTPAAEQLRQFGIEQDTQVPPTRLVPLGQTQLPPTRLNVESLQAQELLVKIRFPIQAVQTLAEEQFEQFVGQLIQVLLCNTVPDGQRQNPVVVLKEESGHTQVLLLLNVRFPVQFWHTFAVEQL